MAGEGKGKIKRLMKKFALGRITPILRGPSPKGGLALSPGKRRIRVG